MCLKRLCALCLSTLCDMQLLIVHVMYRARLSGCVYVGEGGGGWVTPIGSVVTTVIAGRSFFELLFSAV